MIFPLAFLLVTTLLGFVVSTRLKNLRGWAEQAAVGMAIGLMLQLWLPFFTSRMAGIGIGPWIALLLVVLASGAGFRFLGKMPSWSALAGRFRNGTFRENTAILLALNLAFGWLFYTHCLEPSEQGLCSAGVDWEDQSYHAMLASSFLWSDNLRALQYPHFNGWPLGYPFLPDLLAATLARLGATLSQAFWLSAWYAGTAFLLLAWVLLRAWLGSGCRAWLAVILFLLAGGFGFVDFAQELWRGTGWPESLIRHDYTNGWELTLHYENPLTGVLLPMRTSLLGMPVALAILLLLLRLAEQVREKLPARRDLLAVGVLTGLLPLVHAHSFLVVTFCGAVYAALFFRPMHWLRIGLFCLAPLLILALPQLLWTRAQVAISDPFIRWHPGWTCEAKTFGEWLAYWLHNGGLRLPLGLACWWFAPLLLKKLTAPLLALLLIGNLLLFQPYAYDNIKLFVFTDLALAALTVLPLLALWRRPWSTRWLVFPLVLLLTGSGFLSIWRETRLQSTICDWPAVAFAEMVRATTAPRAVFLTSSELTHPVPVLTGRPLVLGYTGWLGQHGVRIGDRQNEVREMFEGGPEAKTLLEKNHVNYVVIGPSERREFPALKEIFFADLARIRFQSGPYTLYELQR